MGLFNFLKKKKNDDYLTNLPPAMRQAFSILFPKGVDDHNRQLDELCSYFGNKYKREDVDSNLIYILTGYLITGNAKTKESVINSVIGRKVNTMSKSDIEYLYTFALNNHSKLATLLTLESTMDVLSYDGCDSYTIPNGFGKFGLSLNNPIPAHGVSGIYEYLDHLRDKAGNKITYRRLGIVESQVSNHPIDIYEIKAPSTETAKLYISAYHKRNSQLSPSGFILVDSNDVVISNGGTKFGIGQRCVPESSLPKLVATNYFGVINSKDLSDFTPGVVEAEKLNRQGFLLSNNGDIEKAISILKEAVTKGSINAINSLFAVLHSAERYQDAHDFLRDCLNSHHSSAALYFNIAIMYAGYDSRYPVKYNYNVVVSCLKRAISLPDDGMEEYRSTIQKKAQSFLNYFYADTELP